MSFLKKNNVKFEEKGIDWDLVSCLEHNNVSFSLDDIVSVLAVFEGRNDGDNWRWIIEVKDLCSDINGGRFVFLTGGCDYTGWDCQSWASSTFAKTAKAAALFEILESKNEQDSVYQILIEQLKSAKQKTWRESKDEEFGVSNLPII